MVKMALGILAHLLFGHFYVGSLPFVPPFVFPLNGRILFARPQTHVPYFYIVIYYKTARAL